MKTKSYMRLFSAGVFLLLISFVQVSGVLASDEDSLLVPGTLTTGATHACGVKTDGTVACWGDNSSGQATPPADTFIQVSAGYYHTCGIKPDGTVGCWGDNSSGQATPPADTFTQVRAGFHHTCGIKPDGTVGCWGDNSYGQATPPADTFTQISTNFYNSCGVKTNGTVTCWGYNYLGSAIPPAGTFTQVSAGKFHACGVKTDGTVACWGDNGYGKATPPVGYFRRISAGGYHSCGIKTDGTVTCWGDNTYNQATPPADTFTQVSAGHLYACGLKTDGTLTCWGDNSYNQSTPPAATFSRPVVSAGQFHTCGVKTDGALTCWGNNFYGESTPAVGIFTDVSAGAAHTCGSKTDGTVACWGYNIDGRATPPAVGFVDVSAGGGHTCGLKNTRSVACWGSNSKGQSTPPAGYFRRISAGGYHSCGIKPDSTLACWGWNNYNQSTPPADTFTQVSAGYYHTCGIITDGTVACWGDNAYNQSTPPADTFTQVSTGYYHTCGIKTDGTLACWGDNTYNQSTPPAGTFTRVSAGSYHTCGGKTDGTLVCWGYNAMGQAPVVSISPTTLSFGITGSPYSQTLTATGGLAPYTFKVVAGTLPGGLALSANGIINGTPASRGTYSFTVQTVDADNISGSNVYILTIGNSPPTLQSMTPSVLVSAAGIAQSITAVYRDMDGYADLKQAYLKINATTSGADSIFAEYNRTLNRLYLYNDAGAAYAGSCTPGVAGTLTNTQGSLNCAATTVSASGNNLTVHWNITPKAAFASTTPKNIYMYVSDMSDATAGWTDKGNWTIKDTNVAPTLGALAPSVLVSKFGDAQSLNAVYSDMDGYANIKHVYLMVNSTAGIPNSITVVYNRAVNKLYLYNDAGTAYAGSCTPGTTGTLTNTQGSLNCAATTVSASGNNLTMNWNVTPKAAFASTAPKNIYMYARDMSNAIAGWTDKGDWTIKSFNLAPTLGTLTPSVLVSQVGFAQNFRSVYSDMDGFANIKEVILKVIISNVIIRYNRADNSLYLYNTAGVKVGSCTPGATGTLTTTQVSLNCASTTVSASGNNLTVNWNITPNAALALTSPNNLYMNVIDMSGAAAGWIDKGNWTVKTSNYAPILGMLTPSVLVSAAGIAQTFNAIYIDGDGFANLKQVYLKINATTSGADSIFAEYNRTLNILYLYNDAGTAYAGSCTPGVAGTLTNTQGSLNCAATTVSASGNNLTVRWNITPKAAFASAMPKNIYMYARDMSDRTAGWTDKGNWTVQ